MVGGVDDDPLNSRRLSLGAAWPRGHRAAYETDGAERLCPHVGEILS